MKDYLVDILIPTYNRPAALAVTLTSLAAQTCRDFRVIISDQGIECDASDSGEVQAALRVLEVHGNPVEIQKHLPPSGMAEQRQFLLDHSKAPYVLFLDDDLILETFVVDQMVNELESEGCGFVGSAVIGLSFIDDIRPQEQSIEFWNDRVRPEEIQPDTPEWERYKLHNAANLFHVQQRLNLTPARTRKYKVAWVGGCVMYAADKLRAVSGFNFWRDLPVQHCGEDVLAQLRVMQEYGGCGLIPSGVYHQELPTTVPNRLVNAPKVLSLGV